MLPAVSLTVEVRLRVDARGWLALLRPYPLGTRRRPTLLSLHVTYCTSAHMTDQPERRCQWLLVMALAQCAMVRCRLNVQPSDLSAPLICCRSGWRHAGVYLQRFV